MYSKYKSAGTQIIVMDILINYSSDKPIYEQICLQIKGLIMDETLQPGEMLPG